MTPSAPYYRIRNWNRTFENHRTRDLSSMRYVSIPNEFDGDGFTTLIKHPQGLAHYGAWVLMVAVASKCEPRGCLVRKNGKPHNPETLARVTGADESVFAAALARLESDEIGWVEMVNADERGVHRDDPPTVARDTATNGADTRDERRENPPRIGGREGGIGGKEVTPHTPQGGLGEDLLRETLERIFYPSGVADHEARKLDRCLERLKAKAAEAIEVEKRVGRWSTHFSVPCSPGGLVEYWDALSATGNRGGVAAVAPAAPPVHPKFTCTACPKEGFEGDFEQCYGGGCGGAIYCRSCIGLHTCRPKRATKKSGKPPDDRLIPEPS